MPIIGTNPASVATKPDFFGNTSDIATSIVENPLRIVTPAIIAGADTYTPAEVLGGLILHDPGGAVQGTFPDAADVIAAIAALGIVPGVNMTFELLVVNTADGAEVLTLAGGAGNTFVPASVTPTQNESTRIVGRLTSVTPTTEAITYYCQTVGA